MRNSRLALEARKAVESVLSSVARPLLRRQEWLQRAAFAGGLCLLAVALAHPDDQAVHFVVDLRKRCACLRAHRGRRMCGAAKAGLKPRLGVEGSLVLCDRPKGIFE